MWYIESYDRSGMGVGEVQVEGMSNAEFARLLGLDEHTYFDGYMREVTGPIQAVLTERLGMRFDPDLKYLATELAEYEGQRSHGMANFADEILPLRDNRNGRLTFEIVNRELPDDELALLLIAHSEYPRQPQAGEFTESTKQDALSAHPNLADLIEQASSIFTARDGYLLAVDRDQGTLILIT
ncbi:hypothetical protein V5P93_006206 [Actinokineospora auranticolor]|uniref:Uncharacterized protein n=1 Tax=Actinokineospora auranticolor TaxID=155976 RepID=A0A2S6GHU1_9PSEU|nr:hypothetical protein [Actinokineospora auranticolor]PPK64802.1 hypothetical protein CLV40_11741 [Actinokineospora auranticolor]